MTFLSRLFKTKTIKAPSVEEQIKALESQTPEQLLTLAASTDNDVIRDAIIAKLPYNAGLLQLALGHTNSRTQLAARRRIGQLLDQQSISVKQLAADVPQQLDLIALASFSLKANLEVVESIQSPELLLQLACEGGTTQLRQAAAARIDTRAELEQLCKVAQSKDKAVYKLAKTKLDVFKAGDAKLIEAQNAIVQLCEKLEKLSRLDADALFKAKVELLEAEWNLLADKTSPELYARYQHAFTNCQQKIAQRAEQIAQEEERDSQDKQASDFLRTAVDEAYKLVENLYSLDEVTPEQLAICQQQLSDLTQAMRLAANRGLPLGKDIQEFERAHRHAIFLLESFSNNGTPHQLARALASPEHNNDTHVQHKLREYIDAAREFTRGTIPDAIQSAAQALHTWSARQAEINRQAKDSLRELSELARKGLWAAQQGMVRKARGAYKELQEKSARLAEVPAGLHSKIEELEQAIGRLSDWHEFAVTPKKEALINQMQSLVNSTLAPNDLAEKIHELQDEWKSLSRGIQQADENLWEQFQQASQAAFAPCKEYFDEQTRVRELNLNKRRELVTQLETYLRAYDWQNAVWSDVEKALKVARQEWQGYWPVPRKAAEELQSGFDALMNELHQKIKDHYHANKVSKQQLIAQAQACATADDLPKAIEQTKQLQSQWKTTGKSFAKEDQQLWHEFRKQCDAVFARRADEIAEVNEQRQQQLEAAATKIQQLNDLSELDFAELSSAKETIATLTREFHALELPRDKAKGLTGDFNALLNKIDGRLTAERNKAEIQSWQDLFSLANSLREYETAVLANSASVEQQTTALAQQLEAPPRLPSGALPLLQQRLTDATALTADIQTRNTHALRLLCIRAEILTSRETPDEDKSLRMNYLMQQLQQGLGKRDESLELLVFEWISVAGVSDAVYEQLFTRFMECLSAGMQS
jgi:exonuclease SbcC